MSRAPSTRVSQPVFYRLTRAMETLLETDPDAVHLSQEKMAEKLSAVIGTPVAASTISSACKTLGVTIGRARSMAEQAGKLDFGPRLDRALEMLALQQKQIAELAARVQNLEHFGDAAPVGMFHHGNGRAAGNPAENVNP